MSTQDEQIVQVIARMQSRLRAYVYAQMPDWAAVDDILQQVWLKVWQKRAEHESIANLSAWIYQVAHFEVLNYRRMRQREPFVFSDALVKQIAEHAAEAFERPGQIDEQREALERCLRQLKPEHRQILNLRYGLDQPGSTPTAEIARATDRSETAIRQALYQIRLVLLKCIGRQMAREAAHG